MRIDTDITNEGFNSKYDNSSWESIFTSFISIIGIVILSILYIFNQISNSDIIAKYEGAQQKQSENLQYLVVMIPLPKSDHSYSTFFLELIGNSSQIEYFSIEAEVFCQWEYSPASLVRQIIPEAVFGLNRIYSTGLFSYDSLLTQIHITGNLSLLNRVVITVVHSSSDFGKISQKLRKVFASISFIALISFIAASIYIKYNSFALEHILTMISLIVSIFTNFPILFSRFQFGTILIYSLDLSLSGVFQSLNLTILLCLINNSLGSQSTYFIFLVCFSQVERYFVFRKTIHFQK